MKAFNIRVYGILINDVDEVLISTERRHGQVFTKFPGGGLEFGEGLKDCLVREFQEELDVTVEVGELFYLTDFFQQSAFHPDHQLISVYYRVRYKNWSEIATTALSGESDQETFRWFRVREMDSGVMTFPIDQIVARMVGEG